MTNSPWSEVWEYTANNEAGGTDFTKLMSSWSFTHTEEQTAGQSPKVFYGTAHGQDLVWEDNPPAGLGVDRCVKEFIPQGKISPLGWEDEQNSNFSDWGSVKSYLRPAVGDEMWMRLWVYIPADFDASSSTSSGNKFLRTNLYINSTNRSSGYLNLQYRLDDTISDLSYFGEGSPDWSSGGWGDVNMGVSGKPTLTKGAWNCVEIYHYFDILGADEGGQGKMKFWHNGVLVAQDNHSTMMASNVVNDEYVRRPLFLQNWQRNVDGDNLGSPKDQTLYYAGWATAIRANGWRDDTEFMARDAAGNPFIGTSLAEGGDGPTVPPIPPPEGDYDRVVSGNITDSQTWDGKTLVGAETTITGSGNVTIPAGAEVDFEGGYNLRAAGVGNWISWEGTQSQPITMRSLGERGQVELRNGYAKTMDWVLWDGVKLNSNGGNYLNGEYINMAAYQCRFVDSPVSAYQKKNSFELCWFYTTPVKNGSIYTVQGPDMTNQVDDSTNFKDCLVMGGTWLTSKFTGTFEKNVLVSHIVPDGDTGNDWTHEHCYPLRNNVIIEKNILIGNSFAAFMPTGFEGSDTVIRNNTIDKKGRGDMYQFHLVGGNTPPYTPLSGVDIHNNVTVDSPNGVVDERSMANQIEYTDYNTWVDVGTAYKNIFIDGKSQGDPGFGGQDNYHSGMSSVFPNNSGWGFPYEDYYQASHAKSWSVNLNTVLLTYRGQYTPEKDGPLDGTGTTARGGEAYRGAVAPSIQEDISTFKLGGNEISMGNGDAAEVANMKFTCSRLGAFGTLNWSNDDKVFYDLELHPYKSLSGHTGKNHRGYFENGQQIYWNLDTPPDSLGFDWTESGRIVKCVHDAHMLWDPSMIDNLSNRSKLYFSIRYKDGLFETEQFGGGPKVITKTATGATIELGHLEAKHDNVWKTQQFEFDGSSLQKQGPNNDAPKPMYFIKIGDQWSWQVQGQFIIDRVLISDKPETGFPPDLPGYWPDVAAGPNRWGNVGNDQILDESGEPTTILSLYTTNFSYYSHGGSATTPGYGEWDFWQMCEDAGINTLIIHGWGLDWINGSWKEKPVTDDPEHPHYGVNQIDSPSLEQQLVQCAGHGIRAVPNFLTDSARYWFTSDGLKYYPKPDNDILRPPEEQDQYSTWEHDSHKGLPYMLDVVEHYKNDPRILAWKPVDEMDHDKDDWKKPREANAQMYHKFKAVDDKPMLSTMMCTAVKCNKDSTVDWKEADNPSWETMEEFAEIWAQDSYFVESVPNLTSYGGIYPPHAQNYNQCIKLMSQYRRMDPSKYRMAVGHKCISGSRQEQFEKKDIEGVARTPNEEEMLWQMYTTLCHGAQGFGYFAGTWQGKDSFQSPYWGAGLTQTWDGLRSMGAHLFDANGLSSNRIILAPGRALDYMGFHNLVSVEDNLCTEARHQETMITGDLSPLDGQPIFHHSAFQAANGGIVLILINNRLSSSTKTVDVSALNVPNGNKQRLRGGSTVNVQNGKFTITLGRYEPVSIILSGSV